MQVSATQDVFPELRNVLVVLHASLESARYEHLQASPMVRATADHVALEHRAGLEAFDAVDECMSEAQEAVARLQDGILSLESVLSVRSRVANVNLALREALTLSHHVVKLLGPTETGTVETHPPVLCGHAEAVAALTHLLQSLGWSALKQTGAAAPISVVPETTADAITIWAACPSLSAHQLATTADLLQQALPHQAGAAVAREPSRLGIRFRFG